MRLVIHAGFGKTGTSWVQQQALPLVPVASIGKTRSVDCKEGFYSDRLRERQYRVFSPVYGPTTMWCRYRNSRPDIQLLAQTVIDELDDLSRSDDVNERGLPPLCVWSDETLLSYGGVELNSTPLLILLTDLREMWTDRHNSELQIDVVLTIREQAGMLRSTYAYDFEHQKHYAKSFSEFVQKSLDEPKNGPSSQLFYDDVLSLLRTVCPPDIGVRLLPYEFLASFGATTYIAHILNLDEAQLIPFLGGQEDFRVNQSATDSTYPLRGTSRLSGIVGAVNSLAPQALINRTRRSPRVTHLWQIAWERAHRSRTLRESAEYTPSELQQIRSLYAPSNRRFQEMTGIPLSLLGYEVDLPAST